MSFRRALLVSCVALVSATVSFCKDATVTTSTGKVHDVEFMRMSHDTIYLRVPNPEGTSYRVTGHKSKFTSVVFKDGAAFDLAWSYYDPDHPAVRVSPTPLSQSDVPYATPVEKAAALQSTKSQNAEQTSASAAWAKFESVSYGVPPDSQQALVPFHKPPRPAKVTVISDPPGATVIIDNTLLAGTTPFTLDSIAAGPHTFRAVKDGAQASKTVSLRSKRMTKVSIKIPVPGSEPVKIRKR